MKISQENISKRKSKTLVSAQDYSLRLISARPYSEKQIAEKLIKKGFSTEGIGKAIKKLKEYGYLNDEAFAERLIENGKRKLIGRIKLSYELYRKGINKSLIDELIEKFYAEDEERGVAVKAMDKKKVSLIKYRENELIFKKKLYDFLQSRGFSSMIIEDILNSDKSN
ncbi:MAG: regulatory protein RecX [bacterium]